MPPLAADERSPLALCSWSLQPASPRELIEKTLACGIGAIQLALDPIGSPGWEESLVVEKLREVGIRICSGMIGFPGEDYTTLETIRDTGGVRLDRDWPANLEAATAKAALAQRLGLSLVTFHAGFIPHDRHDPVRSTMLGRLRQIADAFSARGVRVAFETGQETAETLLDALTELDRPTIGVNFDPANMILYGMGDPIAALRQLAAAGRVLQVHIKDALPTAKPGTWGEEVPVGTGAVDWPAFFGTLDSATLACNLVIEREAGSNRVADIKAAAEVVRKFSPRK